MSFPIPILQTYHLLIRPLTPEDLGDIHRRPSLAFNGSYDPDVKASLAPRKRWLN